MNHPTQCAAFYNHTNLRSGNRIFPCCRFKTPIQQFNGDLSAVLHSDEYKELRKTAETTQLPECAKCWHEETLGKKSLRQQFNENYTTDKIELKYFEVGFDNICNLTCDGCWEEWSHSWWIKKNPDLPAKQGIQHTTEITSIPNSIEKVIFLGGEPLMTTRHRKFLEQLPNADNVTVEYFTNGMFSLSLQDRAVLDQFKSVKFTVSIDGVGMLNESVRSGSVWNTVEKNAIGLAKHYNTVIHTVVHKNNWQGLIELLNWTNINNFDWTTNILTYPTQLDIVNLDNHSKHTLLELCNNFEIPNRDYITQHLLKENNV